MKHRRQQYWTALAIASIAPLVLLPWGGCDEDDNSVCGDGRQEYSEECDDANLEDGDGCSSECAVTPIEWATESTTFTVECTPADFGSGATLTSYLQVEVHVYASDELVQSGLGDLMVDASIVVAQPIADLLLSYSTDEYQRVTLEDASIVLGTNLAYPIEISPEYPETFPAYVPLDPNDDNAADAMVINFQRWRDGVRTSASTTLSLEVQAIAVTISGDAPLDNSFFSIDAELGMPGQAPFLCELPSPGSNVITFAVASP